MSKTQKIDAKFSRIAIKDIDQYSELLKRWDVDFKQLEPGQICAKTMVLATNDILMLNMSCNKAILQRGSSPRNMITFGIPRFNSSQFFWRGKQIVGNNICIYPINGELDSETKSGFDVYGISFAIEYIKQVCEEMNNTNLVDKIKNAEVVTISDWSMAHLRNFLNDFFAHLPNRINNLSHPNFIETIQYEIIKILLLTIEKHLNTSKKSPVRLRDDAFNKAKTYILEHLEEPISVKSLVDRIGVTERTLERAFLERFERTPKAVLKSFRLSGVNRELKRAAIENTLISDVANRWGFWHMGQFAKDYKRMFGELPSITLSKL